MKRAPRTTEGTAFSTRHVRVDPARSRQVPTTLLPAIQPRSGVLTRRSAAVEYSVYTTIIERLLYCWRGRPGVIVHSLLTPSGPSREAVMPQDRDPWTRFGNTAERAGGPWGSARIPLRRLALPIVASSGASPGVPRMPGPRLPGTPRRKHRGLIERQRHARRTHGRGGNPWAERPDGCA